MFKIVNDDECLSKPEIKIKYGDLYYVSGSNKIKFAPDGSAYCYVIAVSDADGYEKLMKFWDDFINNKLPQSKKFVGRGITTFNNKDNYI